MSETTFDAYGFTEVLAVVSKPSPAWVKIRRKDGDVITAAEAFQVGSTTTDEYIFESNNGVVKTDSTSSHNHGPFFHDVYGTHNWMWVIDDDRKGGFPGLSGSDTSTVWQWYGRGTLKRINATVRI